MAIDVVSDTVLVSSGQECLVLMDDWGNYSKVYIPYSQLSSKAGVISITSAQLASNATNMAAMAAALGAVMPAPMSLVQKQAVWAQILAGTYAPAVLAPAPAVTGGS